MSNQIYGKMNEVMKEIGFVAKNQKNTAQGFKFRGIDDMINSFYPALCKHGVFMTPRCIEERSEIKEVTRSSGKVGIDKHVTIQMEYDFFAEDGSKVTVGPIPAEGLDSGDKATNKALSAALKYALIQTFSIPTEDMAEGDLETPEIQQKVNPKQDGGVSTSGYVATKSNSEAPKSTTTTNVKTTEVVQAKLEVKDKTNDLDVALASKEPAKVTTVVPTKAPGKFKVPAKTQDKATSELF